jgi:hypothetical protein
MLTQLGASLCKLGAGALPQLGAALATGARHLSTGSDLKSVLAEKIPGEQVRLGLRGVAQGARS